MISRTIKPNFFNQNFINMRRFLFILMACCISLTLKAQTFTVSGKVVDEKGQPLMGAALKVKGGTAGTTTDLNGAFTLKVPNANSTLVVTYIGYITQEVEVQGAKPCQFSSRKMWVRWTRLLLLPMVHRREQ